MKQWGVCMPKIRRPIAIIGERNINLNLADEVDKDQIVRIGKALSSPVKIEILNLLNDKAMPMHEIAQALDLAISSVYMHIQDLEKAKLVVTETQPGLKGSMRVCVTSMESIYLENRPKPDSSGKTITSNMPIGNYFDFKVKPTCGMADISGPIETYDSPQIFYSPKRMNAQLLWFHQGFIEYRFPYTPSTTLTLKELSFSLEFCSEAPGYADDWPSDITFSINTHELGYFRSPSDFGVRRGRLTPAAWPLGRTQYGLLKTISVKSDGSYMDGKLWNEKVTLSTLNLDENPYISLLIEIKENAEYVGGINIFGENYGDYPQGIIMSLIY